ncbi:hypothetical protein [Halobacterium sp. KA-4]|uniref:hypothetical protein n=1 Tax=Halobacterium sp. KA-4 TaxID=2896367 RepID=UPI003FA5E06D
MRKSVAKKRRTQLVVRHIPRWFESKPFQHQIIILAVILEPLGFVTGYLLAPSLGVEPLMGCVYGLLVVSMLMSLLVMRHNS